MKQQLHKPQEETPGGETAVPSQSVISLRNSGRESKLSQKLTIPKIFYNRPLVFGLENNRFFCYLNSVLQCLLSISTVFNFYADAAFNEIEVKNQVEKGLRYSKVLNELCEEINTKNQTIVKPSQVRVLRTTKLRKLIQTHFSPQVEHDSHEFLLYLLNNLKDEVTEKGAKCPDFDERIKVTSLWRNYTKQFPSVIDRLFIAIEKAQISCSGCKKSLSSLQYYLTFPLHIEGTKSIEQSLKGYKQKEKLPDYKCEGCGSLRTCSMKRQIMKLPEIFILQMQRFSMYPRLHKIRGLISFEEYLDMSEFVDPLYSKENQPSLYQLASVAVHLGTIHGGHYVAYCKQEDDQWYYMDDERVGKVAREEVLQQDAYLLFYRRVTHHDDDQ